MTTKNEGRSLNEILAYRIDQAREEIDEKRRDLRNALEYTERQTTRALAVLADPGDIDPNVSFLLGAADDVRRVRIELDAKIAIWKELLRVSRDHDAQQEGGAK